MGSFLGVPGPYGLLVIVMIVIQAQVAQMQVGLAAQVSNRDDMPALTGAAFRMDRAQMNSIVAMALFAPAVLILHMKGVTGGSALIAANVFLLARLLYVIFYGFGILWFRSIAWIVGMLATVWLYIAGLLA